MGYRLSDDKRFSLDFDYQGEFVPCPVVVTLHDPGVDLREVAEKIYSVSQHPVRRGSEYMAGTAEDARRHKPHS